MTAKYIKIFGKSIVSGLIISVACTAYLLTANKYVGGVLFSFALYCIIRFGFALFTGKVGYIPDNPASYIPEVIAAFVGNIGGVSAGCTLLSSIGTWERISSGADAAITAKLSDGLFSSAVLGFFCGLLMYLAIENSRLCGRKNSDTSLIFGTVMPVMLFIFCGFNHCIADSFYLIASGDITRGLGYVPTVAIGNSLGAMLIPAAKKIYSVFFGSGAIAE